MKLKIELEPVPQSRPRFTRGRCYEPARMRAYKQAIADAARGLGLTHEQTISGKAYSHIRWERVKQYLAEVGFCPEVGFSPKSGGNDAYLPEPVFYMLAMKARHSRTIRK